MIIIGEQFKAGDELIWTHGNGTAEPVRFGSYLPDVHVAVSPGGSAFPDKPTPVAIVVGKNNRETTVPLAELSRPT